MSFENRRNRPPRPLGPGGRSDRPARPFGNRRPGGGGGGGGPQRQGRTPQSAPRSRKPKGPPPKVHVPESPRELREMLKSAAWRLARLVHCKPADLIKADDPAKLIKVPDRRARQLAKKIVRLKRATNA